MMLHRILCGQHDKRRWHLVGNAVHRHLVLVHYLEQRRLSLRRGAVDLIGEQDIREHRARLEFKFFCRSGINRYAQKVAGQHVAGELNALKAAVERPRQRVGQGGLADTRYTLDQQVSAGKYRHQRQADGVVLAANHAAQGGLQILNALMVFGAERGFAVRAGAGHPFDFRQAAGETVSPIFACHPEPALFFAGEGSCVFSCPTAPCASLDVHCRTLLSRLRARWGGERPASTKEIKNLAII